MSANKQLKSDLILHWIITISMLIMLIGYIIVSHFFAVEVQINLVEQQRVVIRTLFYAFAIMLFPITNVIRAILIRLNETMPGNGIAKYRYLVTVIVCLISIEIVGLFGFIMFILGDDYNTLYIFTVLAALGLFLHRPKIEEYNQIIGALKAKQMDN